MERTIKTLISFDDVGREIVERAKEQQRNELANLNVYKQEMYEIHLEHLDINLLKFQDEAEREQEEKLHSIQKHHEEQMAFLRETFLQNNEKWVAQMVANCIQDGA